MMRLAVLVCGASLCGAQPAAVPDAQLGRIKQKVNQMVAGMPNYTCVENLERAQRRHGSGRFGHAEQVRLEVAEASGKELFAPLGAQRFSDGGVTSFVGGGVITNGEFVQYLREIFENPDTQFQDRGREDVDGAPCMRYDYDVPQTASALRVSHLEKAAFVGFHGSVWVDAGSLDLVRLEIIADHNPPEVGIVKATTELVYARFRIGDGSFLLPQTSVLSATNALYDFRNVTEFTHCRQYTGSASISFGEPGESHAAILDERDIVEGLHFKLTLASELDLQLARVGDPLDAIVTSDVSRKGKIIVPAGARILGRLRRVEKGSGRAGRCVLTLEFSEIESGGSHARFFAQLQSAHSGGGHVEVVHGSHLSGAGIATLAFDEPGKIAVNDLQMVWTTAGMD